MDFKYFGEIKAYVQAHTLDMLIALPLQNLGIVHGCVFQSVDDVQSMVVAINVATAGKFTIILGDTVQAEVQDIKEQFDQYELMYETMLADEISKEVLFNLLAFRLTRLERYILNAFHPDIQQYFDSSLAVYKKGCVYADCGALDGYTTAQFLLHCSSYGKIYLYEPMEEYYQNCVENISALQAENIVLRKAAVFNKNTTLHFSANVSGSSRADETGTILVNAVALDEDIPEPIGFIKMDIEGSEKEALRGAERHIRIETPMLAICVYHLPCDLREIPFLIREMNSNYRFYLRHHQYNADETVLYAVPKTCDKSEEAVFLPPKTEAACLRLIERLEKKDKVELAISKKYLMTQVENYMFSMQELLRSIEDSRAWAVQLNEAKEYLAAEMQKREGIIKELQTWSEQLNEAKETLVGEVQKRDGTIKELQVWSEHLNEAKEYFVAEVQKRDDIIKELKTWSEQLNEAKEHFITETQRQVAVIKKQERELDAVANESKKLQHYLKEEIRKPWYKKLLHKSKESDYNL